MPVQWLEQYGQAAGYISAILGLMALILVKLTDILWSFAAGLWHRHFTIILQVY